MPSTAALIFALAAISPSLADLNSLVSTYGLTAASYNFSVPSQAMSSNDASSYIQNNWGLNGGSFSWGANDVVFSPDPSTSTSTLVRRKTSTTSSSSSTLAVNSPASTALAGQSPVLRVGYPAGSYSNRTGGTQFYAQPFASGSDSGSYERMLLSYDVWFPTGFAWNMGGKLPGLRGGPSTSGCSGGSEADGTSCFSTRMMWRSGGQGEVYAYIPTKFPGNFCSQSGITCNSDYGTSLSRGAFSFAAGQWQTVQMLVILNQVGTANGVVQLYYNGVQAISFNNLVLRTASSLNSIGGVFFSTFFGGSDSTWATPTTQYTYYRNMMLFAGNGASNGTGASISASRRTIESGMGWWGAMGAGMAVVLGTLMLS